MDILTALAFVAGVITGPSFPEQPPLPVNADPAHCWIDHGTYRTRSLASIEGEGGCEWVPPSTRYDDPPRGPEGWIDND